jgi:hypothetical protein
MKISLKEAKTHIISCLKAKLPVMLHSSPGIGKSSILKQIAEDFKLEFIDVRLTTVDPLVLSGYPTDNGDVATFKPFDLFPTTNTPIPAGKKGFLICFEELPDSPKLIQSSAYRILLDREVGNHKLHKDCFMVAAGNLASDGAAAKTMSTALQSRMAHLEIGINAKDWLKYATDKGVNQMITSFINWKSALLYNFDPKHTDKTFACPRTWCFLSDVLTTPDKVASQRALINGIIGMSAANDFIAFTTYYNQIPSNEEIIANPKGTAVPTGGIAYALTGALGGYLTEKNIGKAMQYIERMPMELQAVTLRTALAQKPDLALTDEVDAWSDINAARLQ